MSLPNLFLRVSWNEIYSIPQSFPSSDTLQMKHSVSVPVVVTHMYTHTHTHKVLADKQPHNTNKSKNLHYCVNQQADLWGKCAITHTLWGQPWVNVHSLFRHKHTHTFFLCVRLSLRGALGLFSRGNSSARESSKQEAFYVAKTFQFKLSYRLAKINNTLGTETHTACVSVI